MYLLAEKKLWNINQPQVPSFYSNLLPITAGRKSPPKSANHLGLGQSASILCPPLSSSSVHRAAGNPIPSLPKRYLHSSTFWFYTDIFLELNWSGYRACSIRHYFLNMNGRYCSSFRMERFWKVPSFFYMPLKCMWN